MAAIGPLVPPALMTLLANWSASAAAIDGWADLNPEPSASAAAAPGTAAARPAASAPRDEPVPPARSDDVMTRFAPDRPVAQSLLGLRPPSLEAGSGPPGTPPPAAPLSDQTSARPQDRAGMPAATGKPAPTGMPVSPPPQDASAGADPGVAGLGDRRGAAVGLPTTLDGGTMTGAVGRPRGTEEPRPATGPDMARDTGRVGGPVLASGAGQEAASDGAGASAPGSVPVSTGATTEVGGAAPREPAPARRDGPMPGGATLLAPAMASGIRPPPPALPDPDREDASRTRADASPGAPMSANPIAADAPVVRHAAPGAADGWSRPTDGAALLVAGDQAERGGIIPSLILNAAMIPGWPPPRPFHLPDAGTALAELAEATTEPELLALLSERGGEAALRSRLKERRAALSLSRRLRLLLGLVALWATIDALLDGIEDELLRLGDRQGRRGSDPDEEQAELRQALTA